MTKLSTLNLASQILSDFEVDTPLIVFNTNLYIFKITHYKYLDSRDTVRLIIKWCNEKEISDLAYKQILDISDIIKASAPRAEHLNSYMGLTESKENIYYIPLTSQILRLEDAKGFTKISSHPCTQDFFSTYAFNATPSRNRGCKRFIHFLKSILGENEIMLIQEWFGYMLVTSNITQKMMLFYGEGANGKSVLCLVLRLLLGIDKVSSVPIHAFMPNSRFSLADTEGKLANIVEEIDEIDSVVTGQIKQYISGSLVTIERKFQNGYQISPTARLTFATNTLPRFQDTSDGIWRRLLVVYFQKQFLDESLQDKRLSDPEFWLNSGELNGIFMWALRGLQRLVKNEWKFTTPESMIQILKDYKFETRPAEQFLKDNVKVTSSGSIPSSVLYGYFKQFQSMYGYPRVDHGTFSKIVRRTFRSATLTEHPRRISKHVRSRVWNGISIIDDDSQAPTLVAQDETININLEDVSQSCSINLNELSNEK